MALAAQRRGSRYKRRSDLRRGCHAAPRQGRPQTDQQRPRAKPGLAGAIERPLAASSRFAAESAPWKPASADPREGEATGLL